MSLLSKQNTHIFYCSKILNPIFCVTFNIEIFKTELCAYFVVKFRQV